MTSGEHATAARAAPARWARAPDLLVTVGCLLALVLWDYSGADHLVTGWFGNAQGFAWRNHFLTATVVHEGGRVLAWATLLGLLACVLRAPTPVGALRAPTPVGALRAPTPVGALRAPVPVGVGVASTPQRRERLFWFSVTLLCLLLVPAIKQVSATSCPWDMAEYGGAAHELSHWQWGVPDGGSGHCFPSGHAVGAFAFFSQYFLWRPHRAGRARAWLWLVLTAGFIFGLGQLARGAHPVSHSAWSAWICWTTCVLARAWSARRSVSGF